MKRLIPLVYLLSGIVSCVSYPETSVRNTPIARAESKTGVTEAQKRVVDSATSLLGRPHLRFEKASFPSDCSGFVLAAYYLAGIDLRQEYARQKGNGVRRLYQIAQVKGLLSAERAPVVGDILFWDNTYDANNDGRFNDELTHTGIVVASYADGRVDYVHYHVRRGIVRESMNLKKPNDTAHNAPMRMQNQPQSSLWLAAQLYRAKGSLWKLSTSDGAISQLP